MFTIELNNLEKSYSRIFKKHDQTSINLTVFDFYKLNFRIMLRLMKSNGFVPLLVIITTQKFIRKPHSSSMS